LLASVDEDEAAATLTPATARTRTTTTPRMVFFNMCSSFGEACRGGGMGSGRRQR
jgi:hypothetical protein